jgi:trehalose-phosphatase
MVKSSSFHKEIEPVKKNKHPLTALSQKGPLLFLLDYDGTLTDFKKNPEHSQISASTRALLRRLQQKHKAVIVTGRYVDSLFKISGLKKFPVIGSHGFEARNLPKGLRFASLAQEKLYRKEAAILWKAVRHLHRRFPGIYIEKKPFSSTIHFRGIVFSKKQTTQLHQEFNAIYRRTITPRFWNLEQGKKMIEVLPKGFSKGKSVKALLKRFPHHQVIYAGDDVADISVFKVLGKKGLKIAVGNRVPRKYYDLKFKNPREFLTWLKVFETSQKKWLPCISNY